ncbi:hypothetical protein GMRT_10870 [Giardia muris]|uniref:MSP domain-containing protein n=1 Tax=Giardia muris TaxID=5742 RepID=A0A4Z1SYN5_GIAMU|nr:hypothetical protein GMRT_10870 [Giardia muris]|eukprot:TNJ28608.1 hypothetical protein GMRT_10870 [Giardia muris]
MLTIKPLILVLSPGSSGLLTLFNDGDRPLCFKVYSRDRHILQFEPKLGLINAHSSTRVTVHNDRVETEARLQILGTPVPDAMSTTLKEEEINTLINCAKSTRIDLFNKKLTVRSLVPHASGTQVDSDLSAFEEATHPRVTDSLTFYDSEIVSSLDIRRNSSQISGGSSFPTTAQLSDDTLRILPQELSLLVANAAREQIEPLVKSLQELTSSVNKNISSVASDLHALLDQASREREKEKEKESDDFRSLSEHARVQDSTQPVSEPVLATSPASVSVAYAPHRSQNRLILWIIIVILLFLFLAVRKVLLRRFGHETA